MAISKKRIIEEKIPEIAELTSRQREAAAHNPTMGNLYVSGPPGSGKTVILLRRGMYLKNIKNLRVLVLVFNRTLEKYITELKNYDNMEVETWHRWIYDRYDGHPPQFARFEYDWQEILEREKNSPKEYDVIMVDEGQDLPLELYRILIRIARHVSIFADFNQMIKENRESESELLSLLNGSIPLKKVALNENFRNTQSIHDFAEKYLVQIPEQKTICLNPIKGDPPTLNFSLSEEDQLNRIKNYIDNNPEKKVGVFVWHLSDVEYYYNRIKSLVNSDSIQRYHYKLSKAEKDAIDFTRPGAYILTLQSAKGLQFDAVFMPQFIDEKVPEIDSPLCKQRVYVAATRPISELHIFSGEPVPSVLELVREEKSIRTVEGQAPSGWEALKEEEEFLF
ncbi:MAG TPA: AAA family ATPase [bacterium]|nr:AAA family ATPase [bacterium]HPG47231.1 AAA family ATPase [bacterium]HPM99703.1 AAA family ATPase [bacterium]